MKRWYLSNDSASVLARIAPHSRRSDVGSVSVRVIETLTLPAIGVGSRSSASKPVASA